MRHIQIVWHDVDHTRTSHEFDDVADAERWLRDVLADWCPAEELLARGYTPDGIGMLAYYATEGLDEVGTLEVFVDGIAVGSGELYA